MAIGSATLDFGATGTKTASVAVTGQGAILSGSHVEAFVMGETSADHNAIEHRIAPIKLVCGDVVAGVGFTVFAASEWTLTGEFSIRWVWA